MLVSSASERTGEAVSLPAFYEGRARGLAQRLGHQIGIISSRNQGEFVGTCLVCGAQLIVSVAPRPLGMRGTACNFDCRTRQAIRIVPRDEASAGQ
jgi:hypothetical protein